MTITNILKKVLTSSGGAFLNVVLQFPEHMIILSPVINKVRRLVEEAKIACRAMCSDKTGEEYEKCFKECMDAKEDEIVKEVAPDFEKAFLVATGVDITALVGLLALTHHVKNDTLRSFLYGLGTPYALSTLIDAYLAFLFKVCSGEGSKAMKVFGTRIKFV